jgi:hypothetical protein
MRRLRRLFFGALAVTFYRRLVVYERPLDRTPPAPPAPPGASFHLLSVSQLDAYRRLRPDTPAEEIERRLARGDRCFAVSLDGAVVSTRWQSCERAEFEYLGMSFPLGSGLAYAYDGFTEDGIRGSGLSTLAAAHMGQQLRGEGYRSLLSALLPENEGGRRLLTGLGGRPVGTVGCLRLGPVRVPLRRLPDGYLG